jgi:phosphohistidine phosphatase SixA
VDRFRRLDEAGRIMARQLVWAYADREVTKIVSSPYPRCVETVVPLAASRGLAVDQHWELAPDSSLEDVMTLLVDLSDTTLVCTHREVFEKLLGWDAPADKGAAWVLERNGPELVPALYVEPPADVRSGQRQAV